MQELQVSPYSNEAGLYKEHGFAVVPVFNRVQVATLAQFTEDWLYRLIRANTSAEVDLPLESYHEWWAVKQVDHGAIFSAGNRFLYPDGDLKDVLLNANVLGFLDAIQIGSFDIWDDGWGWLGFRFIRPGMNDGYPPSCKDWGPAKGVVSCWIPVIGYSSNETLAVIPNSQLGAYERVLPDDDKFCASEFRLAQAPSEDELVRPELREGEVIFYHPRLIHTEDVKRSTITRLSLEMRFKPKISPH